MEGQAFRHSAIPQGPAIIGILILETTLALAQNHIDTRYVATGDQATRDDFILPTSTAGSNIIVLSDPLNGGTLGTRTGGQFVNGGGWQVTGIEDMIVYDLGRYIENGSLEMEVRNFKPSEQNTFTRQHFLSMFRNPWGNHHPVENQETVWDLHAGFSYNPGVKMLSWTYDEHEMNTVVRDDWDRAQTYQIKVTWNDKQLQYFRNGILYVTHAHSPTMQLRYLFLGRDFTISGDLVTGFKHNQYPALVGPIYANLGVKENVAAGNRSPPQIHNVVATDLYANAARLAWTTDAPAVCYVEYSATVIYSERTTVLGPPAQKFSVTLANLTPKQTYHYRIVALDEAGNVTTSTNQAFATAANGFYLFQPIADTFVEQAGLYGTTREHANLGWMNLLAGAGRECYWRFQITGVGGKVRQAVLRLHGRQSGNAGGILRVLTDAWDETEVTWLTKPRVTGRELGRIDSVRAGDWQEVTIDSILGGNGAYDFALVGSGNATVSWDSRESTNFQPELIVAAGDSAGAITTPVPETLALQNYPNPFGRAPFDVVTRISFALPQAADIHLAVFDVTGREVKTLFGGSLLAGNHETSWDGRDDGGNELSSSIYFLRLRYRPEASNGWSQFVRRMLMVK